jgi:dTDP-glucose 4,6-dehydratase
MDDKKIPVYGDGGAIRDWLHVKDHCQAIDKIIHQGKIGETYCVGGKAEKTNLEITKEVLKAMNKEKEMIEYVEDRKGHDKRYAIDFSKIKNELGWEPSITFPEGIAETIQWYKDNEDWWRKLKERLK